MNGVAALAGRQHDTAGREQHEEGAEPEVAEGHHEPAEQADARRAEQQREPRGDAALGPELAEHAVEQRRRRYGGRWRAARARTATGETGPMGTGLRERGGSVGWVEGQGEAHAGPVGAGASGSTKRTVPPCRSVTQRAIASPRPVPPGPCVGRAEGAERLEPRSRSAAATPGPSSAPPAAAVPGPRGA